ncbi:MAG: undecaprenyl/decaprenyl-phosphate alpha-N-acetylglucosaminyl 1-phosphate transferase [Candidatus Levybacteria bacterium]|nr:undecaprenyl/decaprenyl-phosphate alpha-N-acetylglucosaminyl 1-phosphate transferase [Candidatus Levybacteria bacterium]
MQNNITFFPFVIAFIATALLTPLSLIVIKKFGLFDDPKTHKHPAIIHTKPIPRGGGIPLFLGIVIASFLFLPLNNITIAIFLASLLTLLTGILDDKFDLSPYLRFFINFIAAFIVVESGISVPFITNPFGGILHFNTINIFTPFLGESFGIFFSDFVALIWIIWVMNMLNWSKGVDGQMPGIVAISSIVIGILSLRFPISDPNTLIAAKLSFIIAGSSLGFLIFNFYPAKIFPGYGATAVYLLLSVVSILSGAKLATAILVMGVPMVDGAFTIARRIVTGRSPFWHDNKHLHHLLLRLGLGQRVIALFYWVISAILGLIALTLTSREKVFAIIMILIVVGGALLFLHLALKTNNEKKGI